MASVAEIERIAALVERLIPLSSRQRGELIEADDWNTLVGALLEVARAVVSEAEEGNASPHSHDDQVTAGWLDPVLRARIEQGPLADPASVARVAKLERGLDGLRLDVDGVRTDVGVVRGAASRLEATDLARESSLTRVTRKVDGLSDARDDVSDVRSTLGVLQADLDRVSAFARDLEVDGEMTSVTSLVGRIEQLEGLRERLTNPDGTELNATTLELRLASLQNTLVTEEELDEALGTRPATGLPPEVREQLLADARLAAREQADTSGADLENRLSADISSRLADVEQAATSTAATRAEEISGQLATDLRAELAADITAGDDAVRGTLDEALGSLGTAVRNDVDSRLAESAESFRSQIDRGLESAAASLAGQLDESVAAVRADIGPLAGRITGVERDVAAASAGAAAVDRRLDNAIEELDGSVQARLSEASAAVRADALASDAKVTAGLRAEFAAERQRVDREFATIREQIPKLVSDGMLAARREIDRSLESQLSSLRTDLRTEIQGAVTTGVDTAIVTELERRGLAGSGDLGGRIIAGDRVITGGGAGRIGPIDVERPR